MNHNQNVTPINMLPELEDLEHNSFYNNSNIIPPEHLNKFNKLIRNQHRVPSEAGMSTESYYQNPNYNTNNSVKEIQTYKMPENSPNCLNVAEHVVNCPICSQFYKNDKTIYIIIISTLIIICLLLLKKILDL